MEEIEQFTVTEGWRIPVTAFGDDLLSKNQWAWVLEINSRSLQRWEREVVDKTGAIAENYHFKKLSPGAIIHPKPLDGYRRLILLIIFRLKKGYRGARHTNSSAIDYLVSNQEKLSRAQFYKWRNSYEKRSTN